MNELPLGFLFGSFASGVKPSGKRDLAIIATESTAAMAGVYTQNVVCATSIDWNRAITPSKDFRGIVVNSGNANACTGQQGKVDNETMAGDVAELFGAQAEQFGVLSTGVIGVPLPMEKVRSGISLAFDGIGDQMQDFQNAALAITTTDKSSKIVVDQIEIEGQQIRIAAMAKGAGMIGPNMATMLAIVCTDAMIDASTIQAKLQCVANESFNSISVEGHTSTNDALMLISSQKLKPISSEIGVASFWQKLTSVCVELAKQVPADGEGATHLIQIDVDGAASKEDAERIARTVASSNLVKTAVTGADPNWGRIVSAAGYSGRQIDLKHTTLKLNGHTVFENGEPIAFSEAIVSDSMRSNFETMIHLKVGVGPGAAVHWTSDLTVDYVRFNSEYTT